MRRMRFITMALALLLIAGAAQAATWKVPRDFATIQDAIDDPAVEDGDVIRVSPGRRAGALVDKAVIIKGKGRVIIDDGPLHPAGLSQGFRLLAGSDGAVFHNLTFETDLSIMNGDGVDDVIVAHCTFRDSIQAVSNWRGSGWDISHNRIVDLRTRCGGGIGILVAEFTGSIVVEQNVIEHNVVRGTLHVDPNDCGGYSGSGIVLFADFRGSRLGADKISGNWVIDNKVAMVSDTPLVVDIVAFELTDTRNDSEGCNVVFDNSIGFNDWRGTAVQMALTPANLETCNNISRNLGDNRGHGAHPSLFKP